LDSAQVVSAEALSDALRARDDEEAAQVRRLRWEARLDDPDVVGDPAEQARCWRQVRQARDDAEAARAAIGAQKERVENTKRDRDRAAEIAIGRIDAVTGSDGLDDTWWEDWGSKVATWLATIGEWVASVAGVLALLVCWIPLIGQALAAVLTVIALVGAIAEMLGNIALAAHGETSWGEAILSVVMAALSCVGLGALRGAFGLLRVSFRTLKALGGFAELGGLRGVARTTLKHFVSSVKNTSQSVANRLSTAPGKPNMAGISQRLSSQRQQRHLIDRDTFKPPVNVTGRPAGYFLRQGDAERVLEACHRGTAEYLGFSRQGNIVVRVRGVLGFHCSPLRGFLNQPTHVFMIKGTRHPSVVPTSPGKEIG
jgi:hypothetical protein